MDPEDSVVVGTLKRTQRALSAAEEIATFRNVLKRDDIIHWEAAQLTRDYSREVLNEMFRPHRTEPPSDDDEDGDN